MPYERPNIRDLTAYTPGEQPIPGPGQRPYIKLNTNENPYPPCEEVMESIREIDPDSLRRYPPPTAATVRQTVASVHGLSPDQVIITNGGDELLRLAITVFCQSECENPAHNQSTGIGVAHPSYSLYPILAAIHGTKITSVRLAEDFSLPDDTADRFNDAGCSLTMIVNPHAPSGWLEPLDKLEQFARDFKGVLLVDEAYVDFASHDALPLLDPVKELDNVLLLRTLSKGYSLAGLRLGYGLGHPSLIQTLDKARDSYNVDAIAQVAAIAALKSCDKAATNWQAVIAERNRLTDELTRRGHRVYPSETNFLLVQTKSDAQSTYKSLKVNGVLVRYFDKDPLKNTVRITVGTPQENDALLAALDKMDTA